MPVPFEIITLLGSSIVSGILKIWGMKQDQQKQRNEMTMKLAKLNAGEREEARSVSNRGFQWTRRVIAISAVGSIIVIPKLMSAFYPEMAITYGWTHFDEGFLFFGGEDALTWNTAKGIVITPLDTHIVSSIIGLYFGGSLVEHNRR